VISDISLARAARIIGASRTLHLTGDALASVAARFDAFRDALLYTQALPRLRAPGTEPAKRRGRPRDARVRQLFGNLEGLWFELSGDREMAGVSLKNDRYQGPFVRFVSAFCREMAGSLTQMAKGMSTAQKRRAPELADEMLSAAATLRGISISPWRIREAHRRLGLKRRLAKISRR
jgi:hypothetical protein